MGNLVDVVMFDMLENMTADSLLAKCSPIR